MAKRAPAAATPAAPPAIPTHLEPFAAAMRPLMRMGLEAYQGLGVELTKAKAACKHGEWLPFVAAMGMTADTAQRMMRVAKLMDEADPNSATTWKSASEVLAYGAAKNRKVRHLPPAGGSAKPPAATPPPPKEPAVVNSTDQSEGRAAGWQEADPTAGAPGSPPADTVPPSDPRSAAEKIADAYGPPAGTDPTADTPPLADTPPASQDRVAQLERINQELVDAHQAVCEERDDALERIGMLEKPDADAAIQALQEQLRVCRKTGREWQAKAQAFQRALARERGE